MSLHHRRRLYSSSLDTMSPCKRQKTPTKFCKYSPTVTASYSHKTRRIVVISVPVRGHQYSCRRIKSQEENRNIENIQRSFWFCYVGTMQDAHTRQTQGSHVAPFLMLPLSFNSDCLKRADLNCARKPHLTTVMHFICPLKATGVVITRTRKQGSFKSLETRKSESCCYPTLFARYPGFVRDGKRTKHSRNDTDG